MLQHKMILLVMMSAVFPVCGTLRCACAGWTGPPTIIAPPQPMPAPSPQLVAPLGGPTLKDLPPSAPPASGNAQQATGTSRESSETVRDGETPQDKPLREQQRREAKPAEEAAPQPVEKAAPEAVPAPKQSKTPWLLIAGGVATAFLLGRRTR